MVAHLSGIVRGLERRRPLDAGDIVLDIGSNDGTLLKSYATRGIRRVGIDPTAGKFREFYTSEIEVVCDFFSAEAFRSVCGASRARVITSIAMFYDLEDPGAFVDQVRSVLADDGLWHFEQSYMPSMLRTNAYDTVCHEHLEYYSLRVINELLESRGMRIIGATMNSTNGGSVAVTACHRDASFVSEGALIDWMLEQEDHWGLHTPAPYRHFEERVFKHRADLRRLVDRLVDSGKRVLGYGASTKGNVLLQLCGFGPTQIPAIAEVNPSKFGSYTPGTLIPILPEAEVRSMRPDYLLVLPWHFKHSIIERERDYLAAGGRLIFPLPEIEIVGD
jgi:hypothetical protein